MLAAIITFWIFNGFLGEKVPAGGGFGWDGKIYAQMVRDLGGNAGGGETGQVMQEDRQERDEAQSVERRLVEGRL